MDQFLVPQFIDVEDKIFGPITTRQFVLMLAAMFFTFLLYQLLSIVFFILAGLLNLGFFSVIAFAKINGRPIHFFLLNFLQTVTRPTLRVWNKEAYIRDVTDAGTQHSEIKENGSKIRQKAISGSRLRDLSLVVNTGGVFEGEDMIDQIKTS